MSKITTALFAALTVAPLVSTIAAAHPDHFTDAGPGLSHLSLDPYHLGLTAVAVVVSLMLRRTWLRRKTTQRRAD